jgi:hypothetical protein
MLLNETKTPILIPTNISLEFSNECHVRQQKNPSYKKIIIPVDFMKYKSKNMLGALLMFSLDWLLEKKIAYACFFSNVPICTIKVSFVFFSWPCWDKTKNYILYTLLPWKMDCTLIYHLKLHCNVQGLKFLFLFC